MLATMQRMLATMQRMRAFEQQKLLGTYACVDCSAYLIMIFTDNITFKVVQWASLNCDANQMSIYSVVEINTKMPGYDLVLNLQHKKQVSIRTVCQLCGF